MYSQDSALSILFLFSYRVFVYCSVYDFQSRPSLEQVTAIVDFMEKHPALALGQLRGLEGRDESKKLWFKLTRIVNNITGPTRPMKSWIKVRFKLFFKYVYDILFILAMVT